MKIIFKFINKINKLILPRYAKKDPSKLKKYQQAIIAYRYFILIRSLD
jgi:hypothetical protein